MQVTIEISVLYLCTSLASYVVDKEINFDQEPAATDGTG